MTAQFKIDEVYYSEADLTQLVLFWTLTMWMCECHSINSVLLLMCLWLWAALVSCDCSQPMTVLRESTVDVANKWFPKVTLPTRLDHQHSDGLYISFYWMINTHGTPGSYHGTFPKAWCIMALYGVFLCVFVFLCDTKRTVCFSRYLWVFLTAALIHLLLNCTSVSHFSSWFGLWMQRCRDYDVILSAEGQKPVAF